MKNARTFSLALKTVPKSPHPVLPYVSVTRSHHNVTATLRDYYKTTEPHLTLII